MRYIFLCVIVIILLSPFALLTKAQTSKDLRTKYGPPSDLFQISPGLSLTARYTAEGLACEIMIVQRDVPELQAQARFNMGVDVGKIIDELIPVAKRGRRINHPGTGEVGDCYDRKINDYEFVRVSTNWLQCGNRSYNAQIVWKERQCVPRR